MSDADACFDVIEAGFTDKKKAITLDARNESSYYK
jgi:hypothetical protein